MTYLLLDVVKRVRRVDREANQDDVGIRVGKRAQTIVIFLTSRIPQSQLDMSAIDLDISYIVLEDSRNVNL
jgi:hypothetical protein